MNFAVFITGFSIALGAYPVIASLIKRHRADGWERMRARKDKRTFDYYFSRR